LPLSENLFGICRNQPTFHLVNIVNATTYPLANGLKMCTSCANPAHSYDQLSLHRSGPLSIVKSALWTLADLIVSVARLLPAPRSIRTTTTTTTTTTTQQQQEGSTYL
jgi:hypothetical protein